MKIAIIGYGKMGKEIEKIAIERGHEIVFKFDLSNSNEFTVENLKKTDVAIEFTEPSSAYNNFLTCFDANIPVVSGSTGWLDNIEDIKKRCIAGKTFFYASNFSIGMNLFFKLNKELAELMKRADKYNVQIDETHHTEKKDAPSGTAISLAEDILKLNSNKEKWVKEHAVNKSELAIRSFRREKVPGIHTIRYDSDVDYIEITHSAKNRKGFAKGAVMAAEFIKDKTGFYTMQDLLDF